jgi:hypothetical protein
LISSAQVERNTQKRKVIMALKPTDDERFYYGEDFYPLTPPQPPSDDGVPVHPLITIVKVLFEPIMALLFIGFIFSFPIGFVMIILGRGRTFNYEEPLTISFVLFVLLFIYNMGRDLSEIPRFYIDANRVRRRYYREYRDYRKALQEWPAEKARQEVYNDNLLLQRRAENEQWRLDQIKQAAIKELEAKAEAERQRKAAELQARIQTWQAAYDWADKALKVEYHSFSASVVATYGKLPPEDIRKLFAEAYPTLHLAQDWRIGCLRPLIGSDPIVTAIKAHLPYPNSKNIRPS